MRRVATLAVRCKAAAHRCVPFSATARGVTVPWPVVPWNWMRRRFRLRPMPIDTMAFGSNKFRDREFKTVRSEFTVTMHGRDSFSANGDTHSSMKGCDDLFHQCCRRQSRHGGSKCV